MSKLFDFLSSLTSKVNSSVKIDPQTLTEGQKDQVRANIGAASEDTTEKVLYYISLFDVVSDINNASTTLASSAAGAKVKLSSGENGFIITLLDNISETQAIDIYKDVTIVLNGKTLTFADPVARLKFFEGTKCVINGQIDDSQIIKTISGDPTTNIINSVGESLILQGGTYTLSGSFENNTLCIAAGAAVKNFEINNCTINAINTNNNIAEDSRVRCIQASGENMIIKNSTISADGMYVVQAILIANGTVNLINSNVNAITRNEKTALSATPIFNRATLIATNSNLHGDAMFDDAEHPCADGITNYGIAILDNTNVTGTIEGFLNGIGGQAYINGGTFTGHSHGGFYLAHGIDGIAWINDAVIRCGNYDGIFDYSGNVVSESGYFVAPLASMYLGGGEYESNSNITAYLDNCTFDGPGGYSIVLRGSSGETNIEVNISNSTRANDKQIRIDNSTHKLNVGIGGDITADAIDYPQYAEFNNNLYRKIYGKCDKDDYSALYQHYIKLYEDLQNKKDFILQSSTENSVKKFKITIDDSGVLTATEIED